MLIAHISLPADDPKAAAAVLADIMEGEAIPFPPGGPNAWMAWSGDGDVEIEVVPRGQVIQFGAEEGDWRAGPDFGRNSECHAALCVNRPQAEVIEIARKAGWTARHCERGGGLFNLTEVWIDNAFMLEVLDPTQTALYKERVTLANWKRFLSSQGLITTAA